MEKKFKQQEEERIMLRGTLDVFIINWKWFVVSALVCMGCAWLYLQTRQPQYRRQAVMMVKDDSGTGMRRQSAVGTEALMQLNGIMTGTSVKNEVYVLQSHQLMTDVVRELGLETSYTLKGRFKSKSLYDVRPFTLVTDSSCDETFSLRTDINRDGTIHVSKVTGKWGNKIKEHDYEANVRLGQPFDTPVGRLTLAPMEGDTTHWEGSTVMVTRMTNDGATDLYLGRIKASEMDKMSTLVLLTCTETNIKRADDLLATILDMYKRSIVEDKNLVAESTAQFIDERLRIINDELSGIESKLAHFKRENRLVDVQANANAYLTQSQSAIQRTLDLESQVEVVKFLKDFLQDASKRDELIPTLGGLGDQAIQKQIADYNAIMLQRNKLMSSSTATTPKIMELTDSMDKIRAGILASMDGYLRSLDVQLAAARKVERGMDSNLQAVPAKEQQALDITRQQKIKETLYTFLLNKREETALQLAITEANIRVVERPYGSNLPVAPRKAMVMLVGLIIGLGLPFTFFWLSAMFNMAVRGRRDIEEYTTIPVIGEIPHRKGGMSEDEILVGPQRTDTITEAFRLLRFSLDFINKDARIIMFTSTTPSEGKTFISRNLAVTIGMSGKRVVLVDADIRKRTQSRLSRSTRRDGLTSYLSGSVDNIGDIIIPGSEEMHFDILPAGFAAPNPAELLMSNRLEKLMDELKQSYDYIIVDNVPAQIVADAGIVNRIAELTIYVVREGHIDRRFLPELERLHTEKKFNNMTILLNDCHMEKKSHNYGYGYGYGYVYDERKSWSRKSRFNFLSRKH